MRKLSNICWYSKSPEEVVYWIKESVKKDLLNCKSFYQRRMVAKEYHEIFINEFEEEVIGFLKKNNISYNKFCIILSYPINKKDLDGTYQKDIGHIMRHYLSYIIGDIRYLISMDEFNNSVFYNGEYKKCESILSIGTKDEYQRNLIGWFKFFHRFNKYKCKVSIVDMTLEENNDKIKEVCDIHKDELSKIDYNDSSVLQIDYPLFNPIELLNTTRYIWKDRVIG